MTTLCLGIDDKCKFCEEAGEIPEPLLTNGNVLLQKRSRSLNVYHVLRTISRVIKEIGLNSTNRDVLVILDYDFPNAVY